MRPAYSEISFSTASGAGHGLLAVMGVFGATGLVPADRWLGAAGFVVALGLVTFGLLSSILHPHHPERAWRGLGKWRSSWPSRAGVLATATYAPALVYAVGWVFFETAAGVWGFFGVVTAVFAALTVYATGMIYATRRPIYAWCNQWTVPNYMALALHTGALLLNALAHLFGADDPQIALLAVVAVFLAFYLKRCYWRFIDTTRRATVPETATGPGAIGEAGPPDPPNAQVAFVQEEPVHRVDREHARKLRRTAFLCLLLFPGVLTLTGMDASGGVAIACAVLAVLSAAVGVVVERWLFFAEAGHAETLCHGTEAA